MVHRYPFVLCRYVAHEAFELALCLARYAQTFFAARRFVFYPSLKKYKILRLFL